MKPVFSLPYLGNIEFYSTYAALQNPVIDLGEHYIKQTFRNRTYILGANGPLPLIVPIVQRSVHKQAMSNVQISYETEWQRMHIEAIRSAYGSAPFFEYYFDEIAAVIRFKHTLLSDLSMTLHSVLLEMLEINIIPAISKEYCEYATPDYRGIFHPKNMHVFNCQHYRQVFSEKFPFIPNLSVIDLLFCEGPSASDLLYNQLS